MKDSGGSGSISGHPMSFRKWKRSNHGHITLHANVMRKQFFACRRASASVASFWCPQFLCRLVPICAHWSTPRGTRLITNFSTVIIKRQKVFCVDRDWSERFPYQKPQILLLESIRWDKFFADLCRFLPLTAPNSFWRKSFDIERCSLF